MQEQDTLRQEFIRPPASCRSTPFWAWNGRLDENELVLQARAMKEQGFGGFFLHSREGLETEYMGEDWMRCVQAVVRAAEKLGMEAWLYDEDRWPSGTAGGRVPARSEEYRAKGLTLEITGRPPESGDPIFAAYLVKIDPADRMRLRECRLWRPGEPVAPGETLLLFRMETSRPSEWFNNQSPPDLLNPDTVREFIRCTHEVYKARVGDAFGAAIPGIFSDEPSVHDRRCAFTPGRGWVPWTRRFAGEFAERRGWDIRDSLPFLFFNGEASDRTRHDYWRTVSELFCGSFTGQISRWCQANGLRMTGHYLWENKLGVATRVGGAVMPHYRFEQAPGIDLLGEQIDECITVKQCSSVAGQYGKKTVVAETYGCTGWEFNFEGQKWIGDWLYVLGVTRRCQHLALYTLGGCGKRDYPPSFNYHTPQWKYSHVAEDYFARLTAVLTRGEAVRDVLVIHPASTAWAMLGSNPYGFRGRGADRDIPAVNACGDRFNAFLQSLLAAHYDFDLGDETILSETGGVEGGCFRVNRARYRAVIVPPVRTLLRSTAELLLRFLDAGGLVLAVAPLPAEIEGRPDGLARRLAAHPLLTALPCADRVIPTLETRLPRRVDIREATGAPAPRLLYMLRDLGNRKALFVVNTDREHPCDAVIELDFSGKPEEWDPLTGAVSPTAAEPQGDGMRLHTRLGRAGSRLFLIRPGTPERRSPAPSSEEDEPRFIAGLGPRCRFERTAPNVLPLDRCRCRENGGPWSEPMEIWQAQRSVRMHLGMRPIERNGGIQRYRWIGTPHPRDGEPVDFSFSFVVEEPPQTPVHLALENPEDYTLRLNGTPAAIQPDGWFLDRAFRTAALPPLRAGRNELTLSCRYRHDMQAETVYLIGDFGVDSSRRIVREPETLHFGDWCLQGYFHYCGGMRCFFRPTLTLRPGEKVVFRPGSYSAAMLELRVNGRPAGCIPWRAVEELDITDLVKDGVNDVEIEVTGSARNMMGPFHQAEGHRPVTECASFIREGAEATPEYILQPYGLFGQAGIYGSGGR